MHIHIHIHVHVHIHIHMQYIYIYVDIYICKYIIHICTCVCIMHMRRHTHTNMHIHIDVHMHMHIDIHLHIHIWYKFTIHIHIHIYLKIYVHVHTHKDKHPKHNKSKHPNTNNPQLLGMRLWGFGALSEALSKASGFGFWDVGIFAFLSCWVFDKCDGHGNTNPETPSIHNSRRPKIQTFKQFNHQSKSKGSGKVTRGSPRVGWRNLMSLSAALEGFVFCNCSWKRESQFTWAPNVWDGLI